MDREKRQRAQGYIDRIVIEWRFGVSKRRYGMGRIIAKLPITSESEIFITSYGFTKVPVDARVEISMDGQGRWRDNIPVERFWRTLKYEDNYLKSYESVREPKAGLSRYFRFYNSRCYHQSLDYRTPDEMYESFIVEIQHTAA